MVPKPNSLGAKVAADVKKRRDARSDSINWMRQGTSEFVRDRDLGTVHRDTFNAIINGGNSKFTREK